MLPNERPPSQTLYLVDSDKDVEFQVHRIVISFSGRECGMKMPLVAQWKWYVNRRYWRHVLAAVCVLFVSIRAVGIIVSLIPRV